MKKTDWQARRGNWDDPEDRNTFLSLLKGYMSDPMGEALPHTPRQEKELVTMMEEHGGARIFFLLKENRPVGYLLAYPFISTFIPGRAYNIHDIYLEPAARGMGGGGHLLNSFIRYCRGNNIQKVTLEVRRDNDTARALYESNGFGQADPVMDFLILYT